MRAPTLGRGPSNVLSAAKRLFDGSILRDTSVCLVQDRPLADSYSENNITDAYVHSANSLHVCSISGFINPVHCVMTA
jgi:hypothetical protein